MLVSKQEDHHFIVRAYLHHVYLPNAVIYLALKHFPRSDSRLTLSNEE